MQALRKRVPMRDLLRVLQLFVTRYTADSAISAERHGVRATA
jgi:hypothetical protein